VASASDEPRSDVSDANKAVARACVALRHCSHRPFPRLIRNHSCGIVGPRALDVFCRRHFFDWISCCVSLGASWLSSFRVLCGGCVDGRLWVGDAGPIQVRDAYAIAPVI